VKSYSLTHLSDGELFRLEDEHLSLEHNSMAVVLACFAEIDARRLYVPLGYPSMFAYCVEGKHLSEDSALKRLQAARVARRFPGIFEALADDRLHLAAVCLLAPHLTPANADELLQVAAHKSKSQIEELLAGRFPRSEMLPMVEAVPSPCHHQHAPGHAGSCSPTGVGAPGSPPAPEPVGPRSKVKPQAVKRFELHVCIDQSTHDDLRYAQELPSHQIPSGDIAEVLRRALRNLVTKLEKTKFAATSKPRRDLKPTTSHRHIPAHVKRGVWERDGGQCTFVSEGGRRCEARRFLEFDHLVPVARGGKATVEGMRLRCRAHNQYEGERTFGAAFIDHKRQEARRAAEARARATAKAGGPAHSSAFAGS
jgi:5-methylcytosine-specific restriction endonuclease McrA